MNNDIRLSPHFTLEEFCNWKKYPENIPTMQHVANMTYGCLMLLEPARLSTSRGTPSLRPATSSASGTTSNNNPRDST